MVIYTTKLIVYSDISFVNIVQNFVIVDYNNKKNLPTNLDIYTSSLIVFLTNWTYYWDIIKFNPKKIVGILKIA